MSSDAFNVTGSWDQSSYQPGQTITGTISGDDVVTTTTSTTGTIGPFNLPFNVGNTDYVAVVPQQTVPVTETTVQQESVIIDTSRQIVDSNNRTWQVSADKLHITAVA